MKNIFVFVCICVACLFSGQEILYSFKNNDTNLSYRLSSDNKKSLTQWKMIINAKGDSIIGDSDSNFFVTQNDTVYYNDKTLKNRVFVKDLEVLTWKLGKEQKIILGYRCKSATTVFRGRVYEAFFTEEIKSNLGPWKFRGLKGLILSVKSLDGKYEFLATAYKNDNSKTDYEYIANTISNKNFINYSDYINLYKKDIDDFIKSENCNCGQDGKNILKITKIEKVYPKLHDEGVVY